MASPSLALLKGKNKTAAAATAAPAAAPTAKAAEPAPAPALAPEPVAEPEPDTAPEVAVAEDTSANIEINDMSSEELDQLVKDNSIETPAEWTGWDAQGKKDWLNATYGTTDQPAEATETAGTATAEATVADEPAQGTEVAAPAKTTAKPPTSKKAAKALSGEVIVPDSLSVMVQEVENLKEDDAKKLVDTLAETAEFTFFKLGGVLSVIQANGWFKPYPSFRDFVEKEHGINYRRAVYWVGIYNNLSNSKVPWEKVKHLGWTKLKEIAGILTPDNVDEWVKLAEANTTLQLQEIVMAHLKNKDQAQLSDSSKNATVVTTKTFKVHEDQKATIEAALAKAKEVGGFKDDTPALEHICLDYLGSATTGKSLEERLKTAGLEAALEALNAAYPDVNINVELPADAAPEGAPSA